MVPTRTLWNGPTAPTETTCRSNAQPLATINLKQDSFLVYIRTVLEYIGQDGPGFLSITSVESSKLKDSMAGRKVDAVIVNKNGSHITTRQVS